MQETIVSFFMTCIQHYSLYMMEYMKVAFYEVEPWEREYLKKKLTDFEVNFFEDPLTSANVDKVKDVDAISVFIYSKLDHEVIEQMQNLRFITTRSTGYDHIELDCCKKRN